jgi:Nitronate monooxygenase
MKRLDRLDHPGVPTGCRSACRRRHGRHGWEEPAEVDQLKSTGIKAKETNAMLKTPLCDLFGIEVPIILAPMGTCTSAEFAAAVSNEGGLGGIGTLFRSTAAIKRDIDVVRRLTSRPFAINHIPQTLDSHGRRRIVGVLWSIGR